MAPEFTYFRNPDGKWFARFGEEWWDVQLTFGKNNFLPLKKIYFH